MHDGQNVFDDRSAAFGTSWGAGASVDNLQRDDEIEGIIIVAIDNSPINQGSGRYDEYSPWRMDQEFELPGRDDSLYQYGGNGFTYADFLINDLKPLIDREYRTLSDRKNTAVVGSSMGGLISLVTHLRYQEQVGFSGVFSPAFWFNKPKSFEYVKEAKVLHPLSIYMDIGTAETSDDARADFCSVYLEQAREMQSVLEKKSDLISMFYQEDRGAIHNEKAWEKRFPDMLRFFEIQRLK